MRQNGLDLGAVGVVALALTCGLGIGTPVLLQSCGAARVEPETAVQAFQAVCVAAVKVEAEKRGTDLSDLALQVCSDPNLPTRVVHLLELARGAPELAPLPDAGF